MVGNMVGLYIICCITNSCCLGIYQVAYQGITKRKNNSLRKGCYTYKRIKEEKEIVESTLAELRSTPAQLIQSEIMASLGELTAGIAQEIQNPLNFVNNFSEINGDLIKELKNQVMKGKVDEFCALAIDIESNSEKINPHGKTANAIVKEMMQHSQQAQGKKI